MSLSTTATQPQVSTPSHSPPLMMPMTMSTIPSNCDRCHTPNTFGTSVQKSSPRTIKRPRTQLTLDQRQPICVLGHNRSFVGLGLGCLDFGVTQDQLQPVFFGAQPHYHIGKVVPYVCGNLQVYTNHFGGHTTHISKKSNFY